MSINRCDQNKVIKSGIFALPNESIFCLLFLSGQLSLPKPCPFSGSHVLNDPKVKNDNNGYFQRETHLAIYRLIFHEALYF